MLPAGASWVQRPAMSMLPSVAHQRLWVSLDEFNQYTATWATERGQGLDGGRLPQAIAEQWFHPLSLLSTSTTAALRSAVTSLTDEVLPPVFPHDIPSDRIVFFPTPVKGHTSAGYVEGITALSWTHCYVRERPAVFITSWVEDNVTDDRDVLLQRFQHGSRSRSPHVPRYLLKTARPYLCGTEVTYGNRLWNPHREETIPIGTIDPDGDSLAHRLAYALWSMLTTGALKEWNNVALPPRTAQLHEGVQVQGISVVGLDSDESLLTVRKDRVEDPYGDRNLFVWNVTPAQGGKVL